MSDIFHGRVCCISDNLHYITGIESICSLLSVRLLPIQINENQLLRSSATVEVYSKMKSISTLDIVIICIRNIHCRHLVISSEHMRNKKLIIESQLPLSKEFLDDFPLVLAKNPSTDKIIHTLLRAFYLPGRMRTYDIKYIDFVNDICNEVSTHELSKRDKVSEKTINQRKRGILKKFGVEKSNIGGIYLCRDMMNIIKYN